MSVTVGAPKQHKQPSRKGKRAWRKNVDITEIQDGLESLREEIRQGGPLAEKKEEELFTFDTAGSEEIKKRYNLRKPLKVDQILAERSAVPAVDSRKRPRSNLTDGVYEPASKRAKKDWVSKKEVQRIKNDLRAPSFLRSQRLDEEAESGFDLWKDDQNDLRLSEKNTSDQIQKPRPKVMPNTLRRPPIAMTATGQAVKAIVDPDGGTSYNPSFEEWDDLLNREGEKEVRLEEERRQTAIAKAERDARVAAIAAAPDLESDGVESSWEGFDTEYEEESLKKKRPERKTKAQRNKIRRRKQAENLIKQEKGMKERRQRDQQIMLANLKKVSSNNALVRKEQTDEIPTNTDDAILRRRRMGNIAIPDKTLELVLPDELQESLRRLKPEGNLLNDRFRNLLVNGKVESRKPITQAKKKKQTYTEKWSYKDFGIQV